MGKLERMAGPSTAGSHCIAVSTPHLKASTAAGHEVGGMLGAQPWLCSPHQRGLRGQGQPRTLGHWAESRDQPQVPAWGEPAAHSSSPAWLFHPWVQGQPAQVSEGNLWRNVVSLLISLQVQVRFGAWLPT